MAAGLGFKTFTTGEVLTAADVNGYLMQGVLVFATEAARNSAITSPQEGQFAFTKDTNSLWYYSGSAWVASGATGDIEGVTAGTGISGGGTSGTVTITNSMATAIDAKGDLVVGTGADTFSRLAVGTNGQVLTADSSEATGLKFATPAGGGGALTFITSSTFTNVASATIDNCFTSTYNAYLIVIEQLGAATATDDIQFQLRYAGPTTQTAGYYGASGGGVYNQSTFTNIQNNNANQFTIGTETGSTSNEDSSGFMIISRVGASGIPSWTGQYTDSTQAIARFFGGTVDTSRTYTGILFKSASTNIDGIIRVYGLAKS
jgi:hypothetical protein